MKPKKNRIFCRDCNKYKTLFESESKADNFIKFNHEEIEACSGHAPLAGVIIVVRVLVGMLPVRRNMMIGYLL